MDQYVIDFPLTLLTQSFVEAIAFLAIAVIAAGRPAPGAWAPVAAVGGLLSGVVSLFYFSAYAEMRWLDSGRLFDWMIGHSSLNDALGWARIAGIAMIAVGFVLLALRSRPGPTASGEVA